MWLFRSDMTKRQLIKQVFYEKFTMSEVQAPHDTKVLFRINKDKSLSIALHKDIEAFIDKVINLMSNKKSAE